jgi:hypothetical protein
VGLVSVTAGGSVQVDGSDIFVELCDAGVDGWPVGERLETPEELHRATSSALTICIAVVGVGEVSSQGRVVPSPEFFCTKFGC